MGSPQMHLGSREVTRLGGSPCLKDSALVEEGGGRRVSRAPSHSPDPGLNLTHWEGIWGSWGRGKPRLIGRRRPTLDWVWNDGGGGDGVHHVPDQ